VNGPRLIDTPFQVLHPTDGIKPMAAMLPATPSLEQLHKIIDPHLDDGRMERVTVFYKGGYRDMFVDEEFQAKGLRYNVVATGIYRAGYLAQHPDTDPCTLGAILGPAVLFTGRRVWF
jgi:hypothetical protein